MPQVLGKDLMRAFNVPQITSGPANPLHTYDRNSGYSIGDEYFNTTSSTLYKCVGNNPGAASWVPLTVGAPVVMAAEGEPAAPANHPASEEHRATPRPTRPRE